MNNKHKIRAELEEISPLLSNLKKEESPFKVPTGYFHKMHSEVFKSIEKEAFANKESLSSPSATKKTGRIRTLLQRRHVLQAASFLLLATLGVYFLKSATKTEAINTTPLLANISVEEINTYIEDNIDDFEITELAEEIDIKVLAEVEPKIIDALKHSNKELFEEELDIYIDEIIDEFDIDELADIL